MNNQDEDTRGLSTKEALKTLWTEINGAVDEHR